MSFLSFSMGQFHKSQDGRRLYAVYTSTFRKTDNSLNRRDWLATVSVYKKRARHLHTDKFLNRMLTLILKKVNVTPPKNAY